MSRQNPFWKLAHLSDRQLLDSMSAVLSTQRRALASLVAHLGEVEERRLHLRAAHGSMFTYCVQQLGMSEDEACRRIELARLARRFPALFAELESGRITLSGALVLKPVLSQANHHELLAAARGKSLRQARELVAARFPSADVPSSIRKLPERRPTLDAAAAAAPAPAPAAGAAPVAVAGAAAAPVAVAAAAPEAVALAAAPAPAAAAAPEAAPAAVAEPPAAATATATGAAAATAPAALRLFPPAPVARSSIEPLSAERYRVQFTADAALKGKLELARDLLRHAHPGGDFAPIVSRALDLLIAQLMRRRFGARARHTTSTQPLKPTHTQPAPASDGACSSGSSSQPGSAESPTQAPSPAPPPHDPLAPSLATCVAAGVHPAAASPSPHVPHAARRAVLERDGLGCSWVDANGVRCGSRAWLELDHRQPAGKGGGSEADNLRLLCRPHNRLAAEQAYGRRHIERATARRRQARSPDAPG